MGAAGIRETQELGGLVESFARRIVDRLSEQPIVRKRRNVDQQGVAARHQQRQERKVRRIAFEHGRHQVAFEMMDADRRATPGIGKASAEGRSDQQGADEARPRRIGNRIDVGRRGTRLGQRGTGQRQDTADVVPRSQLRYHPPIAVVHLGLAVQAMGQEAPFLVEDGNRGFIAGGLDAEDPHGRAQPAGRRLPRLFRRILAFLGAHLLESPTLFTGPVWNLLPMPSVRVRENEYFDAALRRFKRACEKAGILTELRRREFYEKPTQERKRKKAAAIKRHLKRLSRDTMRPTAR